MANRLVILRTQLNRCFSTSTSFFQQPKSPLPTSSDCSTSSLVTPPIPVFGLEGRYASAYFQQLQNKINLIDF
jgi:hypothetical protein